MTNLSKSFQEIQNRLEKLEKDAAYHLKQIVLLEELDWKESLKIEQDSLYKVQAEINQLESLLILN